jgi:hypothetical protein
LKTNCETWNFGFNKKKKEKREQNTENKHEILKSSNRSQIIRWKETWIHKAYKWTNIQTALEK